MNLNQCDCNCNAIVMTPAASSAHFTHHIVKATIMSSAVKQLLNHSPSFELTRNHRVLTECFYNPKVITVFEMDVYQEINGVGEHGGSDRWSKVHINRVIWSFAVCAIKDLTFGEIQYFFVH